MNARAIIASLFVVTAALGLGGCASPKPEPLTAAHPIVDFAVGESPRGELARRDRPERIVRADTPANISTRRH